jgi:putative phage-type endonuclease
MIDSTRFIERSTNRDAWLAARRGAVTATEVALAATPAGFNEAVELRRNPVDIEVNEYMEFGNQSEPVIMRTAHHEYGILPSDWLIASDGNPLHMATPDGLSLDHKRIAEVKTTGTDWPKLPPIRYRRQVQWQLYVTGAERCLFLWQLRVPDGDWFRFSFWEPKTLWIERDEDMISDLVTVADNLLEVA